MKTIFVALAIMLTPMSAAAHQLMFDLPHQHDAHYYENLYRQDFERAKNNYILSGNPRYMVPYLGWPDSRGDRTIIQNNVGRNSSSGSWSGSRSSRSRSSR